MPRAPSRHARSSLLLTLSIAGALGVIAGSLAACVGDDPAGVTVEPGESEAGVDGSSSGGDAASADATITDDSSSPDDAAGTDADAAIAGPITTGLAVWLRADRGVTVSGGKVTAWADQSGNGRGVANNNTTLQPPAPVADPTFGGQLAIPFPTTQPETVGASPVLNGTWPTSVPGPLTLYFVYRTGSVANTSGAMLFQGDPTNRDAQQIRIGLQSAGTAWAISFQTNLGGGAPAAVPIDALPLANVSKPHVLVAVENGATSALYLDRYATAGGVGTLPTAASYALSVGATSIGQLGIDGAVAEVLVYGAAHDQTSRQAVTSYLGARYGISIGN